jgi:LPXTG-motif cell wall-anchored protein
VTVTEDVGDSELINEVEVTTEETGKRAVSAREKIQIYGKQEEENIEISEEENAEAAAEPISSNPKTGDGSQGEIWVGICLSSLAAAGLLLRKTRR